MEPGAELIRADTSQPIEGSELQAAEELGLPQCGEVEGGVAFDSAIDSQLSRADTVQPIDGSELQAAEELGLQQCGDVEGGVAFDSIIDSQLIRADTAQPIYGSELQAAEELGLPQCGEVEGGVAFDSLIDSQLIGASSTRDEEEVTLFDSTAATSTEVAGGDAAAAAEPSAVVVKRRRGRPPKPRGGGLQRGRAPVKRKEKEEDEVCFICFDGGTLVVCDRGSCPKVYHPACVNRDEAFFSTSARWNCGWHICSICQKSAHYMCYTCTYSLCKKCIKEAGFICIRGPKGFCATCYKTIMLIELNEVEVDFDNKNSWEHLFKLYWLKLKGKLSFSVEELSGAKNPRKVSNMVALNKNSSDESYNANDDEESSSNSFECHVGSNSKMKKARRDSMIPVPDNSSVNQAPEARRDSKISVPDNSSVNQVLNEGPLASEDTEWASKELLEFVAHMKDGSTHILSQFDVQALLLEYVKRNNLRDPRRKSQIICDPRLQNLFGKPRVGHFEMLKLLESHFLIKEAQQILTDENVGGVGYPDSNQMDAEGYGDPVTKVGSNKRRKNKKRFEDREPQTNLDDYAAIDVHNINLIYLRRNLMEDLIDDFDKFNEKVTGAFVRIRIPSTGQRQDMYRLVQVVGTHKAAEKYKLGKKTTDITLEILNLHKTEVITIDTISNQEFTEEECKRLRQSIKCGLINPLKVGEVQEKIRVLQAVRVNDWLENEKLRLSHLRDRASEKGRRKELRECVEKLQLLSTPEERRRRLNEIPKLHADPKMDPAYASAEGEADDKKQDKLGRPRGSLSLGKGKEPEKSSSIVKNNWSGGRKSLDKVDLFSSFGDRTSMLYSSQAKDVTNSDQGSPNLVADTNSVEAGGWNNNQHTMKADESYDSTDDDRIWNYIDPSGITHGPFSMAQLRKWNTTGYFPPDLRIWTSGKQDESLLLPDALIGKFQRNPPFPKTQHNSCPQPASFPTLANGTQTEWQGGLGVDSSMSRVDTNQNKCQLNVIQNHATLSAADNTGTESANRFINSGLSPRGWETSKDPNAWPGQPKPQIYSSPRPTDLFPGTEGNPSIWNQGQSQGPGWNSDWPREPPLSVQNFERQQSKWSSPVQPRLANESTDQWGYGSFDPPSPTPQPSGGSWANAHFEQVSSGLGATRVHVSHQSPATTTEPNNSSITNSNGGWISSPASNMPNGMPNGSGTEDGGGSWSADGWSSQSTASAHKPKTTEPMDASLSPEGLNGLVDSHASNRQKSALEYVALQPIELNANLQSVSSLAAEDVANRDLISKTLDLATSNTLFFGAQDNQLDGASIKLISQPESRAWSPTSAPLEIKPVSHSYEGPLDTKITEWSLPSPTPYTKSSGRDLVADGTPVNRQIGGTGTSQVISNVGWGTAIQGNINKGWGSPQQGNTYASTSWGAPPDGFTASNVVWGAPTWGNTMNPSSAQGNTNLNLGWGPQKNFDRYDHGQDEHLNKEWPSRPPPRGGQGQIGVCKFHQSGYCKKGSSCKYLHQ